MRSLGDAASTAASNIALSSCLGSPSIGFFLPHDQAGALESTERTPARVTGRQNGFLVVGFPQLLANGFGHLLRGCLAAEVGRVQRGIGCHALYSLHKSRGSGPLAQMLKHHGRGPERSDRVRNTLAGDVEGRAVD